MGEVVTPVQAEPLDTMNINTARTGLSQQQAVFNAIDLGWALTELLSRCFALNAGPAAFLDWSSSRIVTLQETNSPREKLRALMEHIHFLADSLALDSLVIDNATDPENGKRYIDVIKEYIRQLCTQHVADEGAAFEQTRAKINERLFFWNLKIRMSLQYTSTAVYKGYMVGQSLASLRWNFGLKDNILDSSTLNRVCHEYLPALEPYVSRFTPAVLIYTVENWGSSILAGLVRPGNDGLAPLELHRQADIWHSLLIGERDPLSYLGPSTRRYLGSSVNSRYIGKVLRLYSPLLRLFFLTLILIAILLLVIVLSKIDTTVKVTIAAGLLPLLGIIGTVLTILANILQSALTDTSKGSVMDSVRSDAIIEAVIKAIYIPPALPSK